MLKRGLIFALILVLASCRGGEQGEVVGTGGFSLQKASFSDLKGWGDDDFYLFDKAIKSVCSAIIKNPRQNLASEHFQYSLKEYKAHCQKIANINDKQELKRYIKDNFEPYAVLAGGRPNGKFTSYYEANIRASYEKGGKYQYPIYGKPKDLVEINLRDFDSSLPNQRLIGRVKNGKMVKYYTRQEIDLGELNAPVFFGVMMRLIFSLCRYKGRRWQLCRTGKKFASAMRKITGINLGESAQYCLKRN